MRTTFDFTPLFRSSVGFDRMLHALEAASRVETIDNWPPYDIARTDEDAYRITIAVAGFSEGDLDITLEPNLLIVAGDPLADIANLRKVRYVVRGGVVRSIQELSALATAKEEAPGE